MLSSFISAALNNFKFPFLFNAIYLSTQSRSIDVTALTPDSFEAQKCCPLLKLYFPMPSFPRLFTPVQRNIYKGHFKIFLSQFFNGRHSHYTILIS